MIPDLAITHRSYRRQPNVQVTSLTQAFDLGHQPLFQHQAKSQRYSLVQTAAFAPGQWPIAPQYRGIGAPPMRHPQYFLQPGAGDELSCSARSRDRPPGRESSAAGRWGGYARRTRDRPHAAQRASTSQPSAWARASSSARNAASGAGHFGQAFQQRLEIQHGAAHQQRNTSARGDISHGRQGIGTELGRRIALGRVTNID